MLAALEPNCSCALLPFCYIIFNGHGIRSASSQVNSKTFPIPPFFVQVIVLPLPRLIVCCGCIRCFLGCEYLFRKVYPIRYKALESGYWDARWDSNQRPRRMGNLRILPTELLASRNNNIKHFWLVVSGSSELQKTST